MAVLSQCAPSKRHMLKCFLSVTMALDLSDGISERLF